MLILSDKENIGSSLFNPFVEFVIKIHLIRFSLSEIVELLSVYILTVGMLY